MENEFQWELWNRLTQAPGAPGFEGSVRAIMREYISTYTNEFVYDNLGSMFGVMRGDETGPKIMVAGHMDEVGFMVTRISDQGFLSFQALGGWWGQVLLAQRVQIITEKGAVEGVISSIPPHVLSDDQRNRPMDIRNMFIDIGVDSREAAERAGVRPGQQIVPVCPLQVMANPNRLMAKAWDNRYGCSLAVELAKELHERPGHPNMVYVGATVQEELSGTRGAKTAAAAIQPDLFLALDASPATDIPGVREDGGKLGGGLLMRLYDPLYIMPLGLRELLVSICEQENIPYQYYVAKGSTDANAVQHYGKGVPSAVIGIPSRYIHSHASIIDRNDYEAAKRLLFALVRKLDRATYASILPR
ncbi:M42 family metallopeptidase [Brevibacillus sp. SAFN-007a]|uniref:M42 family metallopeptidase n=1 Tax=Brevibacillus sp. SAFN-007a TaxID=3436862 RepID=UPI003F7F5945